MAGTAGPASVLDVSAETKLQHHPPAWGVHPSAHHMMVVSLVLQRQRQVPTPLHRLGNRRCPIRRGPRRGPNVFLEGTAKSTVLVGLVIWIAPFQGFSFLYCAQSLRRRGLYRIRYLSQVDSYWT